MKKKLLILFAGMAIMSSMSFPKINACDMSVKQTYSQQVSKAKNQEVISTGDELPGVFPFEQLLLIY